MRFFASSPSLSDLSPARVPATWVLVGLIAVVFAATGVGLVLAGFEPTEVLATGRPYRARLLVGGQVQGPINAGEWWRLATSTVLHVDLLHLTFNAIALVVLGLWLEPLVGSLRWLGVFAVTAVGASLVSHWMGVAQSDGASAGGLALLAAALVLGWRQRDSLSAETRAALPWLAGFLVANLLITAVWPAVDAIGHLAGVVLGALIGLGMPRIAGRAERIVWLLVVALYAAALVWGAIAVLG